MTQTLIALFAFALSGCFGTTPTYSPLAIENDANGTLVAHYKPRCEIPLKSATLQNAGKDVLWQVKADPPVAADRIEIGETPQGFTETVPYTTTPEPTEQLTLTIILDLENTTRQVTFTSAELPPPGIVKPWYGAADTVPLDEFADAIGCEQQ